MSTSFNNVLVLELAQVLGHCRVRGLQDVRQIADTHFFVCIEEVKDSKPLAIARKGKKASEDFQPALIGEIFLDEYKLSS